MNFKHPRRNYPAHLEFVRMLPCVVCGDDTSTEAAHLRTGNLYYGKRSTGMAEKPDDCWCLPLCGEHHRRQHQIAELQFWANEGINPFQLAQSLFTATGDSEMAMTVIEKQCGTK